LDGETCNEFRYSVTISAGIGFIFLGNVYDNIEKPRQLTVVLLMILSLISLVEAIFINQLKDMDNSTGNTNN
jgi:hypothetical protein